MQQVNNGRVNCNFPFRKLSQTDGPTNLQTIQHTDMRVHREVTLPAINLPRVWSCQSMVTKYSQNRNVNATPYALNQNRFLKKYEKSFDNVQSDNQILCYFPIFLDIFRALVPSVCVLVCIRCGVSVCTKGR